MRFLLSVLLVATFGLSFVPAGREIASHGRDCSIATGVAHADLSGEGDPCCPGDHSACLTHCVHHAALAARPFGLREWATFTTAAFPRPAFYQGPSLEILTPPPLIKA